MQVQKGNLPRLIPALRDPQRLLRLRYVRLRKELVLEERRLCSEICLVDLTTDAIFEPPTLGIARLATERSLPRSPAPYLAPLKIGSVMESIASKSVTRVTIHEAAYGDFEIGVPVSFRQLHRTLLAGDRCHPARAHRVSARGPARPHRPSRASSVGGARASGRPLRLSLVRESSAASSARALSMASPSVRTRFTRCVSSTWLRSTSAWSCVARRVAFLDDVREPFDQCFFAREDGELLVGEPKLEIGALHRRDDVELDRF